MRKQNLFALAVALLSATVFYACKKEHHNTNAQKHRHQPSSALVASTVFPANTHLLDSIVVGVDDTDTYIRKIKLHLSVGLTEVCKDSTIANWIYTQAMLDENKCVRFEDLFNEYPDTKDIIESSVDP